MLFKRKKKFYLGGIAQRKSGIIKYRNPLRIKKGIFKFKVFRVINLILIIGILGVLYFFIFSNFYHITNVQVYGNSIISTDDLLDISSDYLSSKRFLIFKNKNIFVFSKNGLSSKINDVVLLSDLEINKILPNTIRITISEREAALKWYSNNQEYLIDQDGVVIKRFYKLVTPSIFQLNNEIKKQENITDDFIKIYNTSNESINLGNKVLASEDVEFVFKLSEKFATINHLNLKDITVLSNYPQYIEINMIDGWKIYFNLADTLEAQLNRLDVLIKDKIKKENLRYLEYIDLRLGESIFYK
jgi:cell division septal protein FtsQ